MDLNQSLFLNNEHLDVFKEIASMGTAHAATALSDMIGKKVSVSTMSVSWVDFQNVTDFIGGPENVIAGILISLSGSVNGQVMHLIDLESVKTIVGIMLDDDNIADPMEFGEMEFSALKELGNIMISSYINSLAELMGRIINPSVPYLTIDMANAIMSIPVAEFGRLSDSVLAIESKLSVDNVTFSGCFSFVPNLESFQLILNALGVE